MDNSKTAVIETVLALTIFPEQLNGLSVGLFTSLLFVKIFHWLAAFRVEKVAQNEGQTRMTHVRLIFLLLSLLAVDGCFVRALVHRFVPKNPSVLVLFVFEYAILLVLSITTTILYCLHCIGNWFEGKWLNKSMWVFYLETISALLKFCFYLVFFITICTFYTLPFHLLRDVLFTFHTLRERWKKFREFRIVTRELHKFPDATAEEIQSNNLCVVCWDEMTSAKKLPCGHIFHMHCLRSWLQESVSCPYCRAPLPIGRAGPGRPNFQEPRPPVPGPALGQAPVVDPHDPNLHRVPVPGGPPAAGVQPQIPSPQPSEPPFSFGKPGAPFGTPPGSFHFPTPFPMFSHMPPPPIVLRPLPTGDNKLLDVVALGESQLLLMEHHIAVLRAQLSTIEGLYAEQKKNIGAYNLVLERS